MSVGERDPHTGHMTTGHEWNGIKELNTPVPKPVWFFLISAFLFGVGYWLLMPAWPYGVDYTRGLLGFDQRESVTASVQQASLQRSVWTDRIAAESIAEIQADPELMGIMRETAPALFGDNCAVCHGVDAKGGPGYPNIAQSPWMWGDDSEAVLETIRVGINASHPETRYAEMLAFGRDQMLERDDIDRVVNYVVSLSQPLLTADIDPGEMALGHEIFVNNCAGCHAEDATGIADVGAPNLTDAYWIYGGDRATIRASVYGGRHGQMPAWEGRLSEVERKLLALYVLDLRGEQP